MSKQKDTADALTEVAADSVAGEAAEAGPKHEWYVVHTYSGYESAVKRQLEERVRLAGREAQFGEVLVPAERVIELVKGKKREATRNLFPGYILVQMELTDDTWHIINDTPKVTGFVGGGNNPPPISEEEVLKITQQIAERGRRGRRRRSPLKSETKSKLSMVRSRTSTVLSKRFGPKRAP